MSGNYTSNIPVLVVALVIGIVLVTSAVVPLASDYSDAKTFKNEGIYYMTDDFTDYTLKYYGITGNIEVNGELVLNRSDLPGNSYTLISTPEYMIRLQNFAAQSYNLWVFGMDGYNRVIGNVESEEVTITVDEDTISVLTVDDYSYSGEFRGIIKTGKYVMTTGDPFIVSDTDSIIIGNGTTGVHNWYDLFYIIGTVEDSVSVTAPSGITVSNISVNSTPMDGYIDGSKVTSITFDATYDTSTTNATYNRVIVPYEVTLDPDHPDGYKNLVKVIPLMAFIMLVVAAAGMIYFKNKD